MKKAAIVIGAVLLAVVALGAMVGGTYNRFVTLDEGIRGSWAEVDNQLQRRSDLIPNLVNTVKGYAKHESDVFTRVAEARSKLAGARTVNEKIRANGELDSALSRLLAIAENYPALKASENFVRLQDELAGTENRIAVARRRYNASVRTYNVAVKRVPANIVASLTGFGPKDAYFKAEEAAGKVPSVQF